MRLDIALFLVGLAVTFGTVAVQYRWPSLPRSVTTMLFCLASAMIGAAAALLLSGNPASVQFANTPDSGPDCFEQWGAVQVRPSVFALHAVVDGRCVMKLINDQSDAYYVSVVAFHPHGVVGIFDEPLLVKSAPHGIDQPGSIEIVIPLKKSFPRGIADYVLLIVPRRVSVDQFSTIREATNLGGIIAGIDGAAL